MTQPAGRRRASATPVIAVAGVGPRTGVTTTALALAQSWPTPNTASLVVEADERGGQLAALVGADPYLGLASLARSLDPAAPAAVAPERLVGHVQYLPGGVAVLAAPPVRDPARARTAAALLAGPGPVRGLGAAVFADCGVPEPGSVLAPVLAAADVCLVVVHVERTDPDHAARRVRRLTARSPRRGVVLLGADPRGVYARALGVPVVGRLPLAKAAAESLPHGTGPPRRRRALLPAARVLAVGLHEQLHPPPPTPKPPAPVPVERRRVRPPAPRTGRNPVVPSVYRIDPPSPGPSPRPCPRPRSAPPPPRVAATRPAPAAPTPTPTPAPDTGAAGHQDGVQAAEQRAPVPDPVPARPTPPAPTSTPAPAPVPTPTPVPAPVPAPVPVLVIRVFGATRITWRASGAGPAVDITGRLQPRSRALLAVLALHPHGMTREALIEALWGEKPPERPGATLSKDLNRLRRTLATVTEGHLRDPLADDTVHIRLARDGLTADYREFEAAVVARRHAGTEPARAAAYRAITDLAASALATDLDQDWVEPLREAARREYLNALSWLAAHATDPYDTLALLETAIENDAHNETLWREVLRLHARLGAHDALTRTYTALTDKLAEIGEKPAPGTRRLFEQLRDDTE
ncbi:hypothetical protein ACWEKT_07540 [Nocardia takedensis]